MNIVLAGKRNLCDVIKAGLTTGAVALSLCLGSSFTFAASANPIQVQSNNQNNNVRKPKVMALKKSRMPLAATPDELIIMPKQDLDEDDLAQSLEDIGGTVEKKDPLGKFMLVKVDPKKINAEYARARKDPNFVMVERNCISSVRQQPFIPFPIPIAPNDPGFPMQSYLEQLDVPIAWSLGGNGQGIVCASIDTGNDFYNPDLQGRFVSMGLNTVTNQPNGYDFFGPYSGQGESHGTFTMTCYGASTNNDFGFAAPAFLAQIYPINVSYNSQNATTFAIASGIAAAAIQHCKVANLSFGTESYTQYYTPGPFGMIQYMIIYYGASGGMLFESAGNGDEEGVGLNIWNGQKIPGSVVISALNPDLTPAPFTNYGPAISFAAPGVSIINTGFGGQTFTLSGTSFATPLVAGVFSQIWSVNPNLTAQQVLQIMEQTSSIPSGGQPAYYGYGIPDAGAGVLLTLTSLLQPN